MSEQLKAAEILKIEDFRLGNWINYKGHPYEIQALHGGNGLQGIGINRGLIPTIMEGPLIVEQISPILLSEDLLLKAGFDNYEGYMDKRIKEDTLRFYFDKSTNRVELLDYNDEVIIFYTSLHSLQNSYQSLTGRELNLTL